MGTIKIFAEERIDDEARCIVVLMDKGSDLLKSLKPVTPPSAAAIAKVLKFQGPVAGFADEPSETDWFTEKEGENTVIHFGPIADTSFEIFSSLEKIQETLKDSKIEWDPIELDPSSEIKEEDTTDTQGIDGS